jgi:hypothetical protein
MPDDAPAATPIHQRSPLLVALAGFAASALLWFVLRAYTGVFDVLNLRVFVGAFTIVPALAPLLLAKEKSTSVSLLTSACAVGAILGGEALAMVVTGRDIPWSTFNLVFLGVAAVLPFTKTLKQ